MDRPTDYDYLMQHAMHLFPGAHIVIIYTEDEIIHIDVDSHRYIFEIGSDDDSYIFSDGAIGFVIPICLDPTWDHT